ncbi:hypothetical protein JW980_06660 [Acinetobacter johnsonii]|uniref:hypothetical protein n=1 Tax=Acinetobacter johnsonii TaxID=40214 RepID=UPI00196B56EC|nr:hypothetical protein [Acinetobacter johnsonii]QSE47047.1 hypothetical protein JW980_06660 [Acinetobacter johnsonii]
MSVKIKINWDNENVLSESVRIYRADAAFTSNTLPPLLTEIIGDVYEYEDLTTVEDQTYFYMLSAKLGDQEVFTECFEVEAKGFTALDIDLVASTQASLWGGGSVSIDEPLRLAGDISICVLKKITPRDVPLDIPAGWTLLFKQVVSTYHEIYILYKISDQDSAQTSTQTNATAGCTHTILFRPDSPAVNVSATVSHSAHAVTGTSDTFVMPTIDSIESFSYELGMFSWDRSFASVKEPITISGSYVMIQRKEVTDKKGASSMCTFGKTPDGGVIGGSSISISEMGNSPTIFKATVAIVVS